MKIVKLLALAVFAVVASTTGAFAFHDAGVADCAGCHTMHNSQDGALVTDAGGHPYLLKAANSTDACLACHASYGQFFGGEGYGPGGTAVIVDCLTDNHNRTASEVRHAFTKHGGNLGTSGSVAYMFNKQGVISYAPGCDEDAVMEAALEAGADDVALCGPGIDGHRAAGHSGDPQQQGAAAVHLRHGFCLAADRKGHHPGRRGLHPLAP